jgi:hypothetical protein
MPLPTGTLPSAGGKSPLDTPAVGPRRIDATDDDIIEMWQTRRQYAQQMREPYESQWIKNWRMYRAFIDESPDPQDWWRSNAFIPEIFNSIETILPRNLLGMFSKPEWFDVTCPHSDLPGHPGVSCFDYERLVKSLLLGGTKRMNLFKSAYLGHKYGLIMGHSWWKLRWERTETARQVDVPVTDPLTGEVLGMSSEIQPFVSYDDPKLDFVSNFRVWADPTGNNEWFIEEIETTREKLEALQRRTGIYKNLDAIALMSAANLPKDPMNRNTPYSAGRAGRGEEQLASIEGFSDTARDESYDAEKVILLACSGRVPYTPKDGIKWRRTVIANDITVIRDGANPTPDMKPEIFGVQSIPIPGFVYGDSMIRYAGPLNEQLNRIENFRMDEVVLGIWQQYVANRNAVTSNQFLFQPGGVIWVDTINDVQSAFRVLDRKPILPQAYQEAAVKRDQLERTTGATALQQGSTGADRETATSVGARVQLGSERFRLATMWQNMVFKQPLLSRMFALYQRHLPPDRLVRLVGTQFQVPIDISQIQDGIDINIDADVFDLDNAQKQQAFAFFMQTATAPPFAPWWKVPDLLRDAVEFYMQKDGRKYVKSEEEMAMELAAQAQAEAFAGAGAPAGQLGPASDTGSGGGGGQGGAGGVSGGGFGQ